jgi:hypothetical protein
MTDREAEMRRAREAAERELQHVYRLCVPVEAAETLMSSKVIEVQRDR